MFIVLYVNKRQLLGDFQCHKCVSLYCLSPSSTFVHIMTLFFRKRISRKGVQILRIFSMAHAHRNIHQKLLRYLAMIFKYFCVCVRCLKLKNLNINEKTYMGNKTQAMQEVEMFAREISPRFLWMNIMIIVMVNFQRIIMKSESIITTHESFEYHFIIVNIFFLTCAHTCEHN